MKFIWCALANWWFFNKLPSLFYNPILPPRTKGNRNLYFRVREERRLVSCRWRTCVFILRAKSLFCNPFWNVLTNFKCLYASTVPGTKDHNDAINLTSCLKLFYSPSLIFKITFNCLLMRRISICKPFMKLSSFQHYFFLPNREIFRFHFRKIKFPQE